MSTSADVLSNGSVHRVGAFQRKARAALTEEALYSVVGSIARGMDLLREEIAVYAEENVVINGKLDKIMAHMGIK